MNESTCHCFFLNSSYYNTLILERYILLPWFVHTSIQFRKMIIAIKIGIILPLKYYFFHLNVKRTSFKINITITFPEKITYLLSTCTVLHNAMLLLLLLLYLLNVIKMLLNEKLLKNIMSSLHPFF